MKKKVHTCRDLVADWVVLWGSASLDATRARIITQTSAL